MVNAMLEKEYKYYQDNRQNFISKYLNRYIVIKGDEFIKDFAELEEALDFSLNKYEPGTFLIHKVKENENVVWYSSRVYVHNKI